MCDMRIPEGFTLVPHHHGRRFHERLGGQWCFWTGFCFYFGLKGKRLAATALIRVSLSSSSFFTKPGVFFFGKHSHDEDALEFFVSAMDSCLLAIIARLS